MIYHVSIGHVRIHLNQAAGKGFFGLSVQFFSAHAWPLSKAMSSSLAEVSLWPTTYMSEHRCAASQEPLLFAYALTHCILNRLSHTIYWKSSISILGTPGYEIYIFLEKKWLNYLQTVKTLSILRRLIWVCTVCQLPFYGFPTTMD